MSLVSNHREDRQKAMTRKPGDLPRTDDLVLGRGAPKDRSAHRVCYARSASRSSAHAPNILGLPNVKLSLCDTSR